MKILRFLIVLSLLSPLSTLHSSAQNNALRDSLKAAVEKLAYHPDSIDLRLRKAGWNLELKQWEYAKAEYDLILKQDPKNVAALYYRAYTNEKLRRYSFARLDYEYLLTLVPGNFEGGLGLALLNEKDQRHREAMNLLNQLCEIIPPHAEAFAARAGVEVAHKMLYPAEYDYSEAIRLDPENKDYLLARADIRIQLKRKTEAKEDLQRLEKLGMAHGSLRAMYDKCK